MTSQMKQMLAEIFMKKLRMRIDHLVTILYIVDIVEMSLSTLTTHSSNSVVNKTISTQYHAILYCMLLLKLSLRLIFGNSCGYIVS